jgi:hypothetical protein
MIDPRLLNHPTILLEAERRAAEWVFACPQSIHAGCNPDPIIEAFARFLSDPARQETLLWLCMSGAKKEHSMTPDSQLWYYESSYFSLRESPTAIVDRWLQAHE